MIGETTSHNLVVDKLGEGGMEVIYRAQDTRLYPGALEVLATEETPALQARDSIVIAELANASPDPVFDGWLRQAVLVDREQSPFLNASTWCRIV